MEENLSLATCVFLSLVVSGTIAAKMRDFEFENFYQQHIKNFPPNRNEKVKFFVLFFY